MECFVTPYTGNDDIETICESNSANLAALMEDERPEDEQES